MIHRLRPHRLVLALVIAFVLASVAMLEARPGGGETYSGGGSSGSSSDSGSDWDSDWDSGGSGGGDGGRLVALLFRLIWRYPIFFVLILCSVFAYVGVLAIAESRDSKAWDSTHAAASTEIVSPAMRQVFIPPTEAIKTVDPDFSSILFEDFVFRLYATAHGVRHDPRKLDELAPYLSPEVRRGLATRPPAGEPVSKVVIGAMRVYRVNVPTAVNEADRARAVVKVAVQFEANYSAGSGDDNRRYVIETWALQRALSARTRPREAARRFACPNCGAPWRTETAAQTQKCASCGEVVDNGRFDWLVVDVRVRDVRSNLPGLRQEVEERGTDAPTIRDEGFREHWNALLVDDPQLSESGIEARLRHIYQTLNAAWTQRDIRSARPVLSDGLADYLQYWLDAYAAEGLLNVLEDMQLTRHELVKLRRDHYYDALTIRFWATGKDYVLAEKQGWVVRGDRTKNRDYSEYWTLIRSAMRRGAPSVDRKCGGCGAELTVTMAGTCEHCGSHVTAGEFDWVLSKIEQDDSYQG